MDLGAGPSARSAASLPDSRRIRVLFIPEWYPSGDGSNQVTGTFCREHVRAACLYDDVAVLAFSGRQELWPTLQWRRVDDGQVPTFYATYGRSPIPKTSRAFFYLHLYRAFKRIVDEWGRPDVIHTQDAYAYYVIKALQHFDIPFVISQHWSGFLRRLIEGSAVRKFSWAFKRAVRVLPVNKFAEKDYQWYGLHPPVTWLPNVLDQNAFRSSGEDQKEPWLLHASGLTPEKRVPDIIRAFAKVLPHHPKAVLQIVGNGAGRKATEALAACELPANSVQFHGVLSKPQLADVMRRSCGFVMASEAETFCCVLMEAMACGSPVLTTRVGGIPAVVPEGDGLFTEVGNLAQIAEGMRRLLDGTHGLDLERISRETRMRFSQETVGWILHEEHVRASKVGSRLRISELVGSHRD